MIKIGVENFISEWCGALIAVVLYLFLNLPIKNISKLKILTVEKFLYIFLEVLQYLHSPCVQASSWCTIRRVKMGIYF